MSEGTNVEFTPGRWRSRRALSTITAAIVMVVVVVVVGAAAYVALGTMKGGTSTSSTICTPANSPVCLHVAGVHNLQVLAPIKSTQTGTPIPFTAILPSGSTGSSYTFNFGDGSAPATSTTPIVTHAYTNPGTYLVQVSATIGGQVHDNLHALAVITIAASFSGLGAGDSPSVGGAIVSNSSSSTGATSVLVQGNVLTVQGSYLGAPTNPDFLPVAPKVIASGSITPWTKTHSATQVVAQVNFSSAGTFQVTTVGEATGIGPSAGQTAFQNYTWTVVVTPTGVNGNVAGTASSTSPHPGTVIYYSSAQGGASSLDPSIAYDTVSYEPILSVYEGLIMYNGSVTGPDPQDYLPVL